MTCCFRKLRFHSLSLYLKSASLPKLWFSRNVALLIIVYDAIVDLINLEGTRDLEMFW